MSYLQAVMEAKEIIISAPTLSTQEGVEEDKVQLIGTCFASSLCHYIHFDSTHKMIKELNNHEVYHCLLTPHMVRYRQ